MSGHGHIVPNADGSLARCGGPGLCLECSREAARVWPAIDAEITRLRKECKDAAEMHARASREIDASAAIFKQTVAERDRLRAENELMMKALRHIAITDDTDCSLTRNDMIAIARVCLAAPEGEKG